VSSAATAAAASAGTLRGTRAAATQSPPSAIRPAITQQRDIVICLSLQPSRDEDIAIRRDPSVINGHHRRSGLAACEIWMRVVTYTVPLGSSELHMSLASGTRLGPYEILARLARAGRRFATEVRT